MLARILPTLRQFEVAPTHDYQLAVSAHGFESAILKLLPQDASYGETGMSVATASEDLLKKSHALVARYAAVEELVAKLPPDQQDVANKIAAFEGPQKALEWLEMRFPAEHR